MFIEWKGAAKFSVVSGKDSYQLVRGYNWLGDAVAAQIAAHPGFKKLIEAGTAVFISDEKAQKAGIKAAKGASAAKLKAETDVAPAPADPEEGGKAKKTKEEAENASESTETAPSEG